MHETKDLDERDLTVVHGIRVTTVARTLLDLGAGRFVARVGAAYPEVRIALEYESFAWHSAHEAVVKDNARRNAVVGAGWAPIAVTWADLESGGQRVCDEILRARLRRAA